MHDLSTTASVMFAASVLLATPAPAAQPLPVLLLHGNSDNSSFWMTFKWRLEANGYPAARVFALDFEQPLARSSRVDMNDATETPGFSSTADQLAELSAAVTRILKETGASKIILIGHSRAGSAIRNFLWNGGDALVDRVILAAAPTNGVFSVDGLPLNEFNRKGEFMMRLNSRATDVPDHIPALSLRSDFNDLWNQTDGRFFGKPGEAIGAGFDSPALRGGINKVLPGADHKQAALSPEAFTETFVFITGTPPTTLDFGSSDPIVLDGPVASFRGHLPSNKPVPGASVEIFEVSAETGDRIGAAVRNVVTPANGRWGPFIAKAGACYEFVLRLSGMPTTHIYRQPFPRSSDLVRLAPVLMSADEASAGATIVLKRPRGLFAIGRDMFFIGGQVPAARAEGVYQLPIDASEKIPATTTRVLTLPPGPNRRIETEVNGEKIVVRNWPAEAKHVVVAEFHQ